jgi:hypothetical protein
MIFLSFDKSISASPALASTHAEITLSRLLESDILAQDVAFKVVSIDSHIVASLERYGCLPAVKGREVVTAYDAVVRERQPSH